mgnify:CR=1 FL=1
MEFRRLFGVESFGLLNDFYHILDLYFDFRNIFIAILLFPGIMAAEALHIQLIQALLRVRRGGGNHWSGNCHRGWVAALHQSSRNDF